MKPSEWTPSPLNRRRFLVSGLSAAGGLAIGFSVPAFAATGPVRGDPSDRDTPAGATEVNAWILVEPDDSVTLRVAKSEMGEGVLTSMAMLVAEELACDWNKVKVEYASANRNVRENKVYHRLYTGGSTAVSSSRVFLQQAGASARARLIAAAAQQWKVDSAACNAADGRVTHKPSGRSLGYGALAKDAAKIALDAEPAIKTPDQFTLLGKPVARLDTPVKVTGEAVFGIDVRVPEMLYAVLVTCPVLGGKPRSHDAKAIEGRRGVKAVVALPHGIAVVADRFWRAKEAASVLPVEWDYGPGLGTDSAEFRRAYRAALDEPGANAKAVGDVNAAFATGKLLEATYEVPYLAHAPMEPINCTAHVQPGRVDIWMGTQEPDDALQRAAAAAGVPPEQVHVHNTFLGGGFGRRFLNEEVAETVAIAKAVGKPVKLVWTREDDMRRGRYRPLSAIRLKASRGEDGLPTGLHIHTAGGSILLTNPGVAEVKNGVDLTSIQGLANLPYAVPNWRIDCVLKETHIPVAFWRSVGSTQNAFALESFIDELAHAAGQDPYRFRRKLLEAKPDYLKVLDTVAEKGEWGKALPPGKGRGIAIHEAMGSIVGQVVDVAVDDKGNVRVERVVAAVDCGHVVNPRIVEAQIESGIVYGLTAALYGEISIKDGRVEQGNFDSYRMVTLIDAPKIEVHMALSGGAKWGGAGEPGTPPIAPALANAIFAATGKRIRQLPIRRVDLSGQT